LDLFLLQIYVMQQSC